MSLIETKAELTYDGVLRSASSLFGIARKLHLLKGFREFVRTIDDDFSKFRFAGVDVMKINEAISLVQAGAPCIDVAKLAVTGALEVAENELRSGKAYEKRIQSRFMEYRILSGVEVQKEDIKQIYALPELLNSGQPVEFGPIRAVNRNGESVQFTKRLLYEGIGDSLVNESYDRVDVVEMKDNGAMVLKVENGRLHHVSLDLSYFSESHNFQEALEKIYGSARGFVDFGVVIRALSEVEHKSSKEIGSIISPFVEIQDLILGACDIIFLLSNTTRIPNRLLALQGQWTGNHTRVSYASDRIKLLAEQVEDLSVENIKTFRESFTDLFSKFEDQVEELIKSPFHGIGQTQYQEHIAVKLIASRLQGSRLSAKQKGIIEEYQDALLISTHRGTGLVLPLIESLDMAPYHTQIQTLKNHVKPGDVLELYHVSMYLAEGQLGVTQLMKRANNNLVAAEQIFRAHLHGIRRKGTLQLSGALQSYGKVRPYALRELICGLAVSGMSIIPCTAPKWISIQVKDDLGGRIQSADCEIDGQCLVDIAINADGLIRQGGRYITGNRAYYRCEIDGLRVVHLNASEHLNKRLNRRLREERITGLLA